MHRFLGSAVRLLPCAHACSPGPFARDAKLWYAKLQVHRYHHGRQHGYQRISRGNQAHPDLQCESQYCTVFSECPCTTPCPQVIRVNVHNAHHAVRGDLKPLKSAYRHLPPSRSRLLRQTNVERPPRAAAGGARMLSYLGAGTSASNALKTRCDDDAVLC